MTKEDCWKKLHYCVLSFEFYITKKSRLEYPIHDFDRYIEDDEAHVSEQRMRR